MPDQDRDYLRFNGYYFDSSELKYTPNDTSNETNHKLSLKMEKKIKDDDDKNIYVNLIVTVQSSDSSVFLKVSMVGNFELLLNDESEKDIIEEIKSQNTISIMYPYIRAYITNLTSGANMPNITLPVINVNKLTKENND